MLRRICVFFNVCENGLKRVTLMSYIYVSFHDPYCFYVIIVCFVSNKKILNLIILMFSVLKSNEIHSSNF